MGVFTLEIEMSTSEAVFSKLEEIVFPFRSMSCRAAVKKAMTDVRKNKKRAASNASIDAAPWGEMRKATACVSRH